jgi:hypothetical protein
MTRNEVDPEAMTRNEVSTYGSGPETINHDDVTSNNSTKLDLVPMLHYKYDLELHNMYFLFTDISGRLVTFHSFSRPMHTTDCSIHISHGSCYYVYIIFTGSCLFLNLNGMCLFTGVVLYEGSMEGV